MFRVLPIWLQNLIVEEGGGLSRKLDNLKSFLEDPRRQIGVDTEQIGLMKAQLMHMESYDQVLRKRIHQAFDLIVG